MAIMIKRLLDQPIIHQGMHPSLGNNINGPSLIAVPDWVPDRLGRFYLYFSHHEGRAIRLAYADALVGPWQIYEPGAITLEQTPFPTETPDVLQPDWAVEAGVNGLYPHIASPDVHVDHKTQTFTVYFHGMDHDGEQRSLMAISTNGVDWTVKPEKLDAVYLRFFELGGERFALGHGGQVFKETHDTEIKAGDYIFPEGHRHSAVLVKDHMLHVFWTRIGDEPEHIYHSTVDGSTDWRNWKVLATQSVLFPELDWEGSRLPIEKSKVGKADGLENALRDPCIFEHESKVYMIYPGGGEQALGLAQIEGL